MDTSPFIISEKSSDKEFQILEAGSYSARCYSVIDMWTQEFEYQWQKKRARKVRLTFEFPTETAVFNAEKWEQPFVISSEFTYSLNEKSRLRPFLKNWRGRDFTAEELQGFDISKLLGVAGLASISHYTDKKGTERAEITSISLLPKGMECPAQINPSVLFSPYAFDQEVFNSLPPFIQEKIKKSDEMQHREKMEKELDVFKDTL